jgi:hypothetical protein
MYATGLVFLTTALTIALLIREANWRAPNCETVDEAEQLPLGSTYKSIWEMLKLVPIRKLAVILLTSKVNIELKFRNTVEKLLLATEFLFVQIRLSGISWSINACSVFSSKNTVKIN